MKKVFLIAAFLLTHTLCFTQPDLIWTKQIGGTGYDLGYDIAVDASLNVYTIGNFEDTVDFDPGTGIYTMNTGVAGVFVSKLDASGNFVWAKKINGASGTYSIALDNNGNVYFSGRFWGTGDFDPGASVYNLTSAGDYDIFICKLDAAGNFVWAKRMGGKNTDVSYAIALDAFGNVYTTGYFQGPGDFDPSLANFVLQSWGTAAFISKLNPLGNFIWAKRIDGTGIAMGFSIALDPGGNVYLSGRFCGTIDFDPGAGAYFLSTLSFSNVDLFISKLDNYGNFIWARQIDAEPDCFSIAVDANENVYAAGYFRDTVDFDPGLGVFNLISSGGLDACISKFDISGNLLWAKCIGGSGNDGCDAITIDLTGNVYVKGRFKGSVDFDPGMGIYKMGAVGADDVFISKLDVSGNFICAGSIGGAYAELGNSIALDVNNAIYTTGAFVSTADFNPGSGIYNLSSVGSCDVSISKFRNCPSVTNLNEIGDKDSISTFPNPSSGIFTIDVSNYQDAKISIYDLLGNCILNQSFHNNSSLKVDLSSTPKGVYFVEIITGDERTVKKIVLQ